MSWPASGSLKDRRGGPSLFLGLMSGTSLDGVDAVVASMAPVRVLAHVHRPFAAAVREELLALNARGGPDELHRAALAANAVALAYAEAVDAVLEAGRPAGLERADIRAIGAHGQTVRHRPGAFDGVGYTVQLLNAALLAERTRLDVVADLRSRDVAAGGQGAPLVPAFHRAVFGVAGMDRAVLNLGGIANLTLLPADGSVLGFDSGPGNVLMDAWAARHLGTACDEGGRWAAGGRVQAALLVDLMAEPYLSLPPPKSTGRDLFDLDWLERKLRLNAHCAAQDVQATLAEYTARTVAQALRAQLPQAQDLLVCGGGVFNAWLMERLQAQLPDTPLQPTDAVGLPAMQVEAAAFAWLAHRHLARQPGNLPAVTGAAGLRVLGCLHPGG